MEQQPTFLNPHDFAPAGGHAVDAIVHSWKSYTAKKINAHVARDGQLWQEDYWDRIIRGWDHYINCVRYIRDNHVKARLPDGAYVSSLANVIEAPLYPSSA